MIIEDTKTKGPHAMLFCNGTAAFINEKGNQIRRFQLYGWRGLHLFIEKYPEAPVSMSQADPIYSGFIPYLLKNIKEPNER